MNIKFIDDVITELNSVDRKYVFTYRTDGFIYTIYYDELEVFCTENVSSSEWRYLSVEEFIEYLLDKSKNCITDLLKEIS